MNAMQVRALMHELMDENPFAIRAVLRILSVEFTNDVPTLAVFVGVMGGLAAFGFIGLFVGPIVLGLLVALFRYEREERATAAGRR